MRRFLLFILAVLYLGVSSGFALNYHYCMGKLAEVSLQYLDTCPSCGEAGTSHKCCSTETEYVKLSSDLLRKFYMANIQAIMKRIFITRLTYAQHVKRPYILIVVLHHDR